MIRKILFSLLLLCSVQLLFAQGPPPFLRKDLISPSPTAAGLGSYGDIPINHSTGAAGFSVPLFTVSGNELKLPITLSYGYTGFRPNETVGWVGLGWSLQAGGVITRVVKGKLDIPNDATGFSSAYVQNKIYNELFNEASSSAQTFLKSVYKGTYDSEPDIYNFNFNGYSGRFFWFKDIGANQGRYYCSPDQNLKITGDGGNFTIVTEDGTRYNFSASETTTTKAAAASMYHVPPYVSTIYLTSIQNASGTESISLSYAHDETEIRQLGPAIQTYKKYDSPSLDPVLFDMQNSYPTMVTPLRLSSVSSNKHSVYFEPGQVRQDMNGTHYSLGGVSVIDNASGNSLRHYKFNYSNFTTGLQLDSLTETSGIALPLSGQQAKKHRFEYIPGVPGRNSLALDHYGYYNGAYNGVLISNTIYPWGADRDVRPLYAEVGALKKITYPTGGTTEFTYQPNVAYDGNKYKVEDLTITASRSRGSRDGGATILRSTEVPFTLNFEQTISVFAGRTGQVKGDGNIGDGSPDFIIFNMDTDMEAMRGRVLSETGPFDFTAKLGAGNYIVQAIVDQREESMGIIVNYQKQTDIPIEGMLVGGIRIKSIKNTPLTGEPVIKDYSYLNEAGFSTGNYIGPPSYQQTGFSEIALEDGGVGYKLNSGVYYSTFIAESNNSGVQNYYSSVIESLGTGPDQLVTRNEYELPPYFNAQPFLFRSTQYKKTPLGLFQLKETSYDYLHGRGSMFTSFTVTQIMGGGSYEPMPGGSGYPGPMETYTHAPYRYDMGESILKKKTEISYEGAGSLVSVTEYDYSLSRPGKLSSTKTSTSDGKQLITRFKYADDYVPALSSAAVAAHVLSPVWEQQTWRKNSATDSVLVSASLTEYNNKFQPIAIYSLDQPDIKILNNQSMTGLLYNNLKSDTRYEQKAVFNYNTSGQLTGQKITGGVEMAYQWGYGSVKKNYPVAEAKNASATEFFTENFEDNGSGLGKAHTGVKYQSGAYTVNWTRPNSRSYVLSYWYLNNNVWQHKQESYPGNSLALSGGTGYDDVTVYPADAQVVMYAYDRGNISATTDAKGLTIHYVYDVYQRLAYLKDQDGNIVKTYCYNYEGQQTDCDLANVIPEPTTTNPEPETPQPGNGGDVKTKFSYVNKTRSFEPDGSDASEIVHFQVKNSGGNVVFETSNYYEINNLSLSGGTYTFVFTIIGPFFNSVSGTGWISCALSSGGGGGLVEYNPATTVYTMPNVAVSGAKGFIVLDNTYY